MVGYNIAQKKLQHGCVCVVVVVLHSRLQLKTHLQADGPVVKEKVSRAALGCCADSKRMEPDQYSIMKQGHGVIELRSEK